MAEKREIIEPPSDDRRKPTRPSRWGVLTELVREFDEERVNAAMTELPNPEQEIITCSFWLGQSDSVIGKELHISKKEVVMHKQRGWRRSRPLFRSVDESGGRDRR